MAIWLEELNSGGRVVGCHHGNESMLKPTDNGKLGVDRYQIYPTHTLEVPRDADLVGWARRGGRLPICPGHRQPTDTDWADP